MSKPGHASTVQKCHSSKTQPRIIGQQKSVLSCANGVDPVVLGLQIHQTSRCTIFMCNLLQNTVQSQQQEQVKDCRNFPTNCTEGVRKLAVIESAGFRNSLISFDFGIYLRTVSAAQIIASKNRRTIELEREQIKRSRHTARGTGTNHGNFGNSRCPAGIQTGHMQNKKSEESPSTF